MSPPDHAWLAGAGPMFTPPVAMDPLERALGYPYAAPAHSYMFAAGGCLNLDGREAALAAVLAAGRRFPAMTEAEVQDAVRCKFDAEQPLADFVLAAVHDQSVRLAREARLCADAIGFAWPNTAVIVGGDEGGR